MSPLKRIKTQVEKVQTKVEDAIEKRKNSYKDQAIETMLTKKGDIEMQVADHNLSNIFEKSNDQFLK